jgi:hypothetical protein
MYSTRGARFRESPRGPLELASAGAAKLRWGRIGTPELGAWHLWASADDAEAVCCETIGPEVEVVFLDHGMKMEPDQICTECDEIDGQTVPRSSNSASASTRTSPRACSATGESDRREGQREVVVQAPQPAYERRAAGSRPVTPAEAVAKLRAEREQHPYTEWGMASMVLEAEHARLLREAIELVKKMEAVEEKNAGLEEDLNRLRGLALSQASLAAMGAFYRLLTAGPLNEAGGSQ